MPVGLSMPGVRSVRSFSARSMRCSISRIDERYSSSLRRSEAPRSADSCVRPLAHEIEDAAAVLHAARAHVGREARVDVAEQAFEHQAGVRLRRHRGSRPAPRQAVRVRARIAGVAVADGARVVAPELDRSEARLFREADGRDLIDRDAVLDVGARRLLAGARPSDTRRPRARDRQDRRRGRSRCAARGPRARSTARGTSRAASARACTRTPARPLSASSRPS